MQKPNPSFFLTPRFFFFASLLSLPHSLPCLITLTVIASILSMRSSSLSPSLGSSSARRQRERESERRQRRRLCLGHVAPGDEQPRPSPPSSSSPFPGSSSPLQRSRRIPSSRLHLVPSSSSSPRRRRERGEAEQERVSKAAPSSPSSAPSSSAHSSSAPSPSSSRAVFAAAAPRATCHSSIGEGGLEEDQGSCCRCGAGEREELEGGEASFIFFFFSLMKARERKKKTFPIDQRFRLKFVSSFLFYPHSPPSFE